MITQTFVLDSWDSWIVKVYYAVNRYHVARIIRELESIGCSERDLQSAAENMEAGRYNMGLTYSNHKLRRSVMVIGLTDSADEFANTMSHEVGHLAAHIGSALRLDPYGEDLQYLTGDITMKMFPIARQFLCNECRKKIMKKRES